ncbi:MAG: hypothetical protein IT433_00260 [Phycisphaerales bacterium]|nr:hypothetical protein [Phycisphaerales bacterium]
MGWVGSSKDLFAELRAASLVCLVLSLAFGIMSLSAVPHLSSHVRDDDESIYHTWTAIWIFPWQAGERRFVRLKWLCWPQHALFLIGAALYCTGAVFG